MAVCGTVVMEDTIINFAVVGDKVQYTVVDACEGISETLVVDHDHFARALGVALSISGEQAIVPQEVLESVMPKDPFLRFIP